MIWQKPRVALRVSSRRCTGSAGEAALARHQPKWSSSPPFRARTWSCKLQKWFLGGSNSNQFSSYVGHGGAEQYIRGSKIRSLRQCAARCCGAVPLVRCEIWATLIERARPITIWLPAGGSYPGTALDHVVNITHLLSPTLVATLWDVTDRDIDTFAQSTFDKLKLNFDGVKARKSGTSNHTPVSVVNAVATSREVCKLKYMNGAAPVVYGIPFYL
jgi:separase